MLNMDAMWTCIIQMFTYRDVYYLPKPSERTF